MKTFLLISITISSLLLSGCEDTYLENVDFSEREKFSKEESIMDSIQRCDGYNSLSQCNLENPRKKE